LDTDQKKKVARLAYCWCLLNLKKSRHWGNFPKIIIKKGTSPKYKGYFSEFKNIICVYLGNHKSILDICDTVLHEWKHHQQDLSMYDTYITKYGRNFSNHPYERTAENFAIKNSKECKKWVVSEIETSDQKINKLIRCIKST
jgi:hypothetical protein